MKSKDWHEIKNMTDIELNTKLCELGDKFFRLKFRHSVSPVKNPLEIREIRRNIAKIKTLVSSREEHNKIK
ncbi:MAG: 50S ribosomal protein L29 [Endomicrobium sp.]|jgi:large subunit ribosomal protein L29|nr:50S ribosomal protein L29 [Endomicrobium sp.]